MAAEQLMPQVGAGAGLLHAGLLHAGLLHTGLLHAELLHAELLPQSSYGPWEG